MRISSEYMEMLVLIVRHNMVIQSAYGDLPECGLQAMHTVCLVIRLMNQDEREVFEAKMRESGVCMFAMYQDWYAKVASYNDNSVLKDKAAFMSLMENASK
jgi:hypothetical protein